MNGLTTVNYLTNEQLIGKFHVINLEKINGNNHEDMILPQTSTIIDDTGCASRFQMIRVDRNFGRGRWKVNDYEPPENTSISILPSINTIENESNNNSNVPTIITTDSNVNPSTTFAASVAAATATVFQQQQQQQQRMVINNTPTILPTANISLPSGHLHAYPNAALTNQSYLLSNHPPHHHQFGYFPFYPLYSPFATSWAAAAAAALAASHSFLQPPTLPLPPQQLTTTTTNLNDPIRISDTDINNENVFSNLTSDQLQYAQLAATASYLYATQYLHSSFVPQTSSTMPSYHPIHHPPPPPTIIPSQIISNNSTDNQQSNSIPSLISPKTDTTKNLLQQSPFQTTPITKPSIPTTLNGINHVNDLLSSSPAPSSLISPINIPSTNVPTTSLSDIWTSYTTAGSPLNLTQTAQTAAVTAVAAMGFLNNDTSQNTEIANEILKELTTPTKQNNTADIDNKISAAMDLVKMHLLSAVREEVTELRQQIRTLNEKVNNIEHENIFLRQHVPSEIYAQYIPLYATLSSSNDSTNSTINTIPSLSSQSVPMSSLSTTNFPLT